MPTSTLLNSYKNTNFKFLMFIFQKYEELILYSLKQNKKSNIKYL